jgi:hypothetical protein
LLPRRHRQYKVLMAPITAIDIVSVFGQVNEDLMLASKDYS